MKEKTSLVFTGDIGFDRYMYGKWDDENKISLYVRYVDLESGEIENRMINKNK